jgi:formamidopyrimidine-DNA glycosylase
MPSLPELEVYRSQLAPEIVGQKIVGVEAVDFRVVRADMDVVTEHLVGGKFTGIGRYGKWLMFETDEPESLIFHLGLTGKLKMLGPEDKKPRYDCLEIHFENERRLVMSDFKHLGKIYWRNFEEIKAEKGLGPDLLDMSEEQFVQALSRKKRARDGLMDQKKIAGIGGKYADEVLWQAKVHPNVHLNELGPDKLRELYRLTMQVTATAIELEADVEQFPQDWLIPHRKTDLVCPRSGGPITERKMGGSSVYYCPVCQVPPNPYE